MTEARNPIRTYDAIIIGTGQAGPSLAHRLAAAGMTVAVIERGLFGGTCVNAGCIPTKTLIASAYAAHMARRAADFGVRTGAAVSVDMPHRHTPDGPRRSRRRKRRNCGLHESAGRCRE
jgi:pyruvate/2-oxoglutarate dehydrogenase complex dihydrolipoamide dehydrogenase (E3) component